MTYAEKLKDPRWQKKRLQILERDNWECQYCGDKTKTLHVHHLYYEYGNEPWDYPEEALTTLCFECHDWEEKNFNGVVDAIKKNAKKNLCCSLDIESLATALSYKNAKEGLYKVPLQYIFRHADLLNDVSEMVRLHLEKEAGKNIDR